jgi:hypothetical protein
MLSGAVLSLFSSGCVEFQTDANSLWCCTGGTIAREDDALDLQDKYDSTCLERSLIIVNPHRYFLHAPARIA